MKIAFVSQPEYFRFTYEEDLDDYAEVFEFPFHFGMPSDAFEPLIAFDADYIFFFRGEFVPEEVLGRLKGCKIALSSEPFPRKINGRLEWTLDSVIRYETFRSIRHKHFDYAFHYDAASLDILAGDGLHLSGAFPFPVATGSYYEEVSEKRWDIFFIGRSSAHREKFFMPLKHWYHFLHICHGIWGPELNHYMNQSKICLNVHAENEISWEPRMQMMLACGAFVISEPISTNDILRPGVDYVEVRSPGKMFECVKYYLENEAERNAIAASGRQRVLEMLNASTCFSNMISRIESGEVKPFHPAQGRVTFNLISAVMKKYRKASIWFQRGKG